jgi:hypothetical protein
MERQSASKTRVNALMARNPGRPQGEVRLFPDCTDGQRLAR